MEASDRMNSRLVFSAVLATALGAAHAARANGAFPDELSIHFPPNSPHRILVGANFGLLVSEDDGATWRYSCEPYVTTGSSDPLSAVNVNFYQVASDDTVLADWLLAAGGGRLGRSGGRPRTREAGRRRGPRGGGRRCTSRPTRRWRAPAETASARSVG